MKLDTGDVDLERRFRAALQEVMPQLIAAPGESWRRDAHDAGPLIEASSSELPVVRNSSSAPGRQPRAALGVAAAWITVVAVGTALVLTLDRGDDETAPVATAGPSTSVSAPADPAGRSLLSAPVPAGVQPMMVVDRDDWRLESYSTPRTIAPAVPSAACAGCGVSRLIIAADGPLFSGPVFTAWAINDDYDVNEFDSPVTIGTAAGRFIGSPDASTPADQNRVRVVWPLEPGRTAFVDANGFTNEQVFEIAATLTFDSAVPALPELPSGFVDVSTPSGAGFTQQFSDRFERGTTEALGMGSPVIELIVTDGGLQGLLDWRNPGGLVGSWGEPRTIDGVTVLLDREADPNEPPILTISATWVVGDWNYTAIGHVFETEADFLSALADLQLTDESTYTSATAAANSAELGLLTPTVDGTSGALGE